MSRKITPTPPRAAWDLASGLSCITRFPTNRSMKPESVLEHTGAAALLCLAISDSCFDKGEINTEKLLRASLIHDAEEIITGDIARPSKYFSKETERSFKALSRDAAKRVLSVLWPTAFEEWSEAKGEGLEGQILNVVDHLCALFKSQEEVVLFSNNSFSLRLVECRANCRRLAKKESLDPRLSFLLIRAVTDSEGGQ